jgi:hypothetical protein
MRTQGKKLFCPSPVWSYQAPMDKSVFSELPYLISKRQESNTNLHMHVLPTSITIRTMFTFQQKITFTTLRVSNVDNNIQD